MVENCFNRPDKKNLLDCVMSMPGPEKTLGNVENALRLAALPVDEYQATGFKVLVRNDSRGIAKTLAEIEMHFGLA